MDKQIMDQLFTEEFPAKTWSFCGKFPIEEVAKGRRACRANWRSGVFLGLGLTNCMLAVTLSEDTSPATGEKQMIIQYEHHEDIDGEEPFCILESLRAEDWYLEDE